MRTCGIEGCDKPHRARGLCSTHYNLAHQPDRHPVVEVPCAYCGTMVAKDKGRDKRYANVFCGYPCRTAMRRLLQGCSSELPRDHMARCYGKSSPWSPPEDAQPRFIGVICRECGTHFVADRQRGMARAAMCSDTCANRLHRSTRRARKRAAWVAPVYRLKIYERDDWRCHLCGKKVKRGATVPDHLAPVLDHVIPLARGGTHEPANVRCAHYICNTHKGDRGSGEQLMLIG